MNPFIIDRARVSDDDDDSRANATGPPKITATAPSPLLARLATFLPTMERANEALRGKSASEVCVETTTEDSDEARIEMVRETTREAKERRDIRYFSLSQPTTINDRLIERLATRAIGFGTRCGGFEDGRAVRVRRRRRGGADGDRRGRGDAPRRK